MTLLNPSLLEFSPLGIHFAKTIKDITDNAKRIRYMSLGRGEACLRSQTGLQKYKEKTDTETKERAVILKMCFIYT